jgi:hypothetical protein
MQRSNPSDPSVRQEYAQCKDAADAELTRLGMRKNPSRHHSPHLDIEEIDRLGPLYDPYEPWVWADLRHQEHAIEKFVRERGEVPKKIQCNIALPDIDWNEVDELGGLSEWERSAPPKVGEEGHDRPACSIRFADGYEVGFFRYADGTWGGALWDDERRLIQWIDPRRGATKAKTDFPTWESLLEHLLKVAYKGGPVRLEQKGGRTIRGPRHQVTQREMEAVREREEARRRLSADIVAAAKAEGLLEENPRRNPGYWKQTALDLLHSMDIEVDEVAEFGTPAEPLVSIELADDRKFDVWMLPNGDWQWAGGDEVGDVSDTIAGAIQGALA